MRVKNEKESTLNGEKIEATLTVRKSNTASEERRRINAEGDALRMRKEQHRWGRWVAQKGGAKRGASIVRDSVRLAKPEKAEIIIKMVLNKQPMETRHIELQYVTAFCERAIID